MVFRKVRQVKFRLAVAGLCCALVVYVVLYATAWPFDGVRSRTWGINEFFFASLSSESLRPVDDAVKNVVMHIPTQRPGSTQASSLKAADITYPGSPAKLFRFHNVTGESPDLLDNLYQRFMKVDSMCRSNHTRGRAVGIFTDDPSRVAYCFLPKAGCTFWIRVFSYLHNFTRDAAKSPWDIHRLKLHSTRLSRGVPWAKVRSKAQNYLRFMFVRHPFSRLWSAYLDKLFLPDFWKEKGVRIVQKLRGSLATSRAQRCGNDVTFAEFVEFSLMMPDPHWDPIYLRCDPCQFKPMVIGSMKTFANDSLFLLRRMNLEWVLKNIDKQGQDEQELNTLIIYNFERVKSKTHYRSCVSYNELARLLWKTFQKNGYIPNTSEYTEPASGVVSMKEFRTQVLEAYRAALPRKRELKKQKADYLREALASLSPQLMEKVRAKYHQDMTYFGFDETNY